jgi:glutamine synthetase
MTDVQGAAPATGAIDDLRSAVASLIEQGALDTVGVGAADFNAIFRGKYLPARVFLDRVESPMAIGDMLFAFDPVDGIIEEGPSEGWWPISDRGLREMRCLPIGDTFRLVPWRERTAIILSTFTFNDGQPVLAEPRRVLQRVIERARSLGYEPRVGYELEFYLFRESPGSLVHKGFHDLEAFAPAQAWAMSGTEAHDGILRRLRAGLEEFGIPIEAWSVEGGAGQYEINVPYCDALEAADRAFLHRFAIKELAAQDGLMATFMARPPGSIYGSSLHLHHSLWTANGRNAMSDPGGADRLSDVARAFIAGQLDAQGELICLMAPLVNSYKRLLPGMSSGASATWGMENWSTAVRVIASSPRATRVEMRTSGADANPYLAIAATLAAGLHGIERGLEPPPRTAGLAEDAAGAQRVPGSLDAGIAALEGSAVARDFLGSHFVDVFLATRRGELAALQASVTDWETERYLRSL